MSRAFFLSLRSFVRRDLVRREVVRVLPLALLLRLGYEVTGVGGSRTFPGRFSDVSGVGGLASGSVGPSGVGAGVPARGRGTAG